MVRNIHRRFGRKLFKSVIIFIPKPYKLVSGISVEFKRKSITRALNYIFSSFGEDFNQESCHIAEFVSLSRGCLYNSNENQ